jgi:hypothetical protein
LTRNLPNPCVSGNAEFIDLGLRPRPAKSRDTLSLTTLQIGMYGLMAFAQLYIFRYLLESTAEVISPEFWFTMQIPMLAGFTTSYAVNWRLIKVGIKERM